MFSDCLLFLSIFDYSISNLKVVPVKTKTEEGAILSFSASVYPDGDIFNVASNKKKAETEARGSDVKQVWLRNIDGQN